MSRATRLNTGVRQNDATATFAGLSINPVEKFPLNIPTYDGNPNVGHPAVVFFPGGFNGWRYWMAFTPFPYNDRENPSIVVSQNGVDWQVPAGLTNPIAPASEAVADGYTYNSDPDLVQLPDGRLAVYYRAYTSTGSPSEGIYRKTSTDGITWSPRQLILTNATGSKLLAPSMFVEDDGTTLTMWTVDDTAASNSQRVVRRQSTDGGVTFGAPTVCTVPSSNVVAWHIDVVKAAGKYHMLVGSKSPFRNYYWTSTDGITWTGSIRPALPLTGASFDVTGQYRSTFVAVPGSPHAFQLWVTGVNSPDPNNVWDKNATWRIAFYDKVTLPLTTPEATFRARMRTGQAYGSAFSSLTTAQIGNGDLRVSPLHIADTNTVTKIGGNITVAGSTGALVRYGVWADDGSGYPGALVFDSGTFDATVTGNVTTGTLNLVLQPGLYWIGAVVQGNPTTGPTFQGGAGGNVQVAQNFSAFQTLNAGYRDTTATGAFGPTFNTTLNFAAVIPRVLMNFA